jgi:sugar/nucleoside kinase (ribokinase family)
VTGTTGTGACHGLLAGWDLEPLIRFASAAGAMPAAAEVEALLTTAAP